MSAAGAWVAVLGAWVIGPSTLRMWPWSYVLVVLGLPEYQLCRWLFS